MSALLPYSPTNPSNQGDVVRAVANAFNSCPLQSSTVINILDKNNRFLRYKVPQITHTEFHNSIGNFSSAYASVTCGMSCYDPSIGYYAKILLQKRRDQADSDYVALAETLEYEKHALFTDEKESWEMAFKKTFYPEDLKKELKQRQQRQKRGIRKIVEAWEKRKLFAKVFTPSKKYRMNVLGHYPEYVACNHLIMFVYKPLTPVPIPENGILENVTVVYPPDSFRQKAMRKEFDEKELSRLEKLWRALPPPPQPKRAEKASPNQSNPTRGFITYFRDFLSSIFAFFKQCLRSLIPQERRFGK
jgi:hypothetical protein